MIPLPPSKPPIPTSEISFEYCAKTENSSVTHFDTRKRSTLNVEHINRLCDCAWKMFYGCQKFSLLLEHQKAYV